ncbi:MAG TPA: 50S ribosomal protein L25 [Ktedonobacteraceae bacterium]|nr:50S ribosomal protein L25 [Ktedonobacteraceae bacterium]
MPQQVELEIQPRSVLGKASKRLRKAGILPANIFGRNKAPQAVQLNAHAFEMLIKGHHGTSVITLRIPETGATETALIRHVQHEPRTGKPLHVDFFRVSLTDRVTVKVPLHFVGESPAVKNEGGVLLHLMDTLEVETEAGNIPEYIEVDVSPLAQIDDLITAGAVVLPQGVTLIAEASEPVVKVAATRAEVAEEVAEAPATATAAAAETPAEAAE